MSKIHNRMPAIIQPQNFDAWLGGSAADVNSLLGMLSPYPERLMEAYMVSKAVSTPAHEGPSLIEPLYGVELIPARVTVDALQYAGQPYVPFTVSKVKFR